MRYSLIIPHYNDVSRLQRLLDTVPVNRADIEVIVVDDCSPDHVSVKLIKDQWPTVCWMSTPKNSGAGAARNIGLAEANGQYLIFADSDDQFLPDAFGIFDEHITPEFELVYFLAEAKQEADDSRSLRADRMNELCSTYLNAPSEATLKLLNLKHVVPWAKVYSRQFIKDIAISFEEVRFSNDVAFNVLSAIQTKKLRVVPKPVYVCFRRPDSLTGDPTPEAFLERVGVQIRLASALKMLGVESQYLPSGTGLLMKATFGYGLITAYKTGRLIQGSDLKPINPLDIFKITLWMNFFRLLLTENKEKKKASRNSLS